LIGIKAVGAQPHEKTSPDHGVQPTAARAIMKPLRLKPER
jgi:hypothetical protein